MPSLLLVVHVPCLGGRGGSVGSARVGLARFVCEQPPDSLLVRGVEADVLPTCARHGMGVIAWGPLSGGWQSGRYRTDAPLPASLRAARFPGYFDTSLPANRRKLEAADQLARLAKEAGLSLIEMSLAFVINHPAVTAAIVGPRTMEYLESQLPAADVVLDDFLLDRIDEIVQPAMNVNAADGGNVDPIDGGWANPALEPVARRR